MKTPVSLLKIENLVYDLCRLNYHNLLLDPESIEYDGCSFTINNLKTIFRCGKITPTKVGQFVTFYQRKYTNAKIEPFDISNNIDLFIVCTFFNNKFGQFVFPKSALIQNDIISVNKKGGKRAFRVYPPWDKTLNKHAITTQKWQLQYFLDCTNNIDIDLVLKLYGK